MALNTINSGVDTSFSTKLNGNFKEINIKSKFANQQSRMFINNNRPVAVPEGIFVGAETAGYQTTTGFSEDTTLVATSAGAYVLETYGYPLHTAITAGYGDFKYKLFGQVRETDLTASSTSGVVNTDDTVDISSKKHLWMRGVITKNTNAQGEAGVYITDSTSEALIYEVTAGSTSNDFSEFFFLDLYLDTTNNNAYWTIYILSRGEGTGDVFYTNIKSGVTDISSLSGALYIRARANEFSSGTYSCTISHIREELSSYSTTVTQQLSANGGSNYTANSNGGYVTGMTSGSFLQAKISGTIAANEGIEISGVDLKPDY